VNGPFGVALTRSDRLKTGLQTSGVPTDRFMVPMHARSEGRLAMNPKGAAGILPADQSEESTAGKMPAAHWWRRLARQRFMVPMHAKKRKRAFHEPESRAGVSPAKTAKYANHAKPE